MCLAALLFAAVLAAATYAQRTVDEAAETERNE
jgi:hypothetical protein